MLLMAQVVAHLGEYLSFDVRVERAPVQLLGLFNLLLVLNFDVSFLLVIHLSLEEIHVPALHRISS